MKLGKVAGGVAVIYVLLHAGAVAADEVPKRLEKQTQELVDAITAGNAAIWDRYLDPSVIYVDESGAVLSKKDFLGDIRPLPAGVTGSIKVTEFRAAVHGDTAVATYVNDENEDYHGHKLHCQYRATDTWKQTSDGWKLIGGQILALRTDPPARKLPKSLLEDYVGTYRLAEGIDYVIRLDGDALEGQQTGRHAVKLLAEGPDVLFSPGRVRYRYVFQRDAAGKVTGFAERREAWDLEWTRVAAGK